MCEPSHSIVQYPDKDDDDNPTAGVIDAIPAPQEMPSSMWAKFRKKVGEWFHFSFMGHGHSESIGRMSPFARRLLPQDTKYETAWWERRVRLDGTYHGPKWNQQPALEAATEYANRVCIGNMTSIRQFLELSMRHSERPYLYLERFYQMLTHQGRNSLYKRIKRLGETGDEYEIKNLDLVIKLVLGYTRKRGLLVPEWADHGVLWAK